MPLEKYYCGDEAFARLAGVPDLDLDAQFEAWHGRQELLALCGGDSQITRVVFHVALTHALEYMKRSIPALDDLTPVECMKTDWGRRRFKECLMRSP